MKFLAVLFFALINLSANAQQPKTSLVCSGKYHNFAEGIRDAQVTGDVIHILANKVQVGIIGFSYSNGELLDYKIISSTDSKITFRHSVNEQKIYLGVLNRYSGEVSFTQIDSRNPNQIEQMFSGICVTSKRKF
jgi:hypothetical protein